MADTSLSAEEQRQIEKEKAHEKAVSDSIQGLFAGGLSAAGAMPRKPSIVAKKEPPGSPKKEGAPASSKRSGSVALPPAAERRGSQLSSRSMMRGQSRSR